MGNDSQLNIIVRAKNEASKVLDQVRNDVSGVGGHIAGAMKASVPASQALGVAVAAVGAATVAFGKSSIDAYNGAVEASTKLRTNLLNVKGATAAHAEELENLAGKLQSVGVIEDDVIKAGMSQLATFNLQASTIGALTPKITDMVAQLKGHNATAEDMVNINNLVGKVMTGNVGALSRYGITLSDNQKKLLEQGNEAQRAAVLNEVLAQNYGKVNEELRKTPQGMITGLKNAWGDLQEGVGEFIVVALGPVVAAFNGWIQKIEEAGGFIEYFKKLVKDNEGVVWALGTAIAVGLVPAIVSAMISMGPAILALGAIMAVGAALSPVIKNLVERFGGWKQVLDNAKEAAKGVFETVRLLVTGDFRGGIFGMAEDSSFIDWLFRIREGAIQLGNTIKGYLVGAWNTLKAVLDFLMPSLTALWNTITTNLLPALMNLWNTVSPILIPALKAVAVIIGAVFVAAIWVAINILNVIIGVISWLANALSGIINVVSTVVGAIVSYLTFLFNFWKAIFTAIYEVVKFAFQVVAVVIATVISGIMAVVQPIAGALSGPFQWASNTIRNIWGGITGFFSGIVSGIRNALSGVTDAITTPFSKAYDWVKGLPGRIADAIGNVGQVIRNKLGDWDIPGPLGKVRDVIPGFATGVRNFAGGLAYVHKGEMLVNLPPGTDVMTRGQTNQMLANAGGGTTNNFYGTINLNSAEAVDRFAERFNRDQQLAELGVPV